MLMPPRCLCSSGDTHGGPGAQVGNRCSLTHPLSFLKPWIWILPATMWPDWSKIDIRPCGYLFFSNQISSSVFLAPVNQTRRWPSGEIEASKWLLGNLWLTSQRFRPLTGVLCAQMGDRRFSAVNGVSRKTFFSLLKRPPVSSPKCR